jgi:hypothetical protein
MSPDLEKMTVIYHKGAVRYNSSVVFYRELEGVRCGDLFMSYKSIFQDMRTAIDHVHLKVSGSNTMS